MFDENVASIKLSFGVRILADSLIGGQFTSAGRSLAAITHSLDKVVILDTEAAVKHTEPEDDLSLASLGDSATQDFVCYVAIRDVIKSIGAVGAQGRDLLLIGCPNSVIIYDVQGQLHLQSIRTSSSIECILVPRLGPGDREPNLDLAICAGPQKLYTIKFNDQDSTAELTSERSTGGSTTSCLTMVGLGSRSNHFLLTGHESNDNSGGSLCLFQLDLAPEQSNNIQACRLRLDESSPVTCLCAIPTSASADEQPVADHFAYGLQNGLLGVYRLLVGIERADEPPREIRYERLWRHKCKCTPISIELFDIDGDGRDELCVGFATGRLELRSPLTGQLLGATRLAGQQQQTDRAQQQQHVGLKQLQLMGNLWLLTGTGRGSIIGFRPQVCKVRQPLQAAASIGWPTQRAPTAASESDWRQQTSMADEMDLRKTIEQTDLHTSQSPGGGGGEQQPPTAATSGSSIEARQSYDLLQKINSLYANQIDLRQRLRRAFDPRKLADSASRYLCTCRSASGDGGCTCGGLSIRHRWDLDLAKLELRLTIVVAAGAAKTIGVSSPAAVKLVQVEEEKRILIESGCQLLLDSEKEKEEDLRDASFVSQLKFSAANSPGFEPTSLKLKVLMAEAEAGDDSLTSKNHNRQSSSGEICQKLIDVPKFAMFTFAAAGGDRSAISSDTEKYIRLCYRLDDSSKFEQVFDWLEGNFLCLQAEAHISGDGSQTYARDRTRFLQQQQQQQQDEDEGEAAHSFQLSLLDAKQTLRLRSSLARGNNERSSSPPSEECKSAAVEQSLLRINLHRRRPRSRIQCNKPDTAANRLEFACENADLAVHLVQSLVIDRLRLDPISSLVVDVAVADAGAGTTSGQLLPKLASILSAASQPSTGQQQLDNLVACCRTILQAPLGGGEDGVNVRPLLVEFLEAYRQLSEQSESESRILTELYESADYAKSLIQQLSSAIELNEFSIGKELLGELFMMLDGTQNAARGHALNERSRLELERKFQQVREKLTLITTGRPPAAVG